MTITSGIKRTFSVLLLVLMLVMLVPPTTAWGLDVVKCTAKTNSDDNKQVMGATQTRINWEGQAAEDESIAGFTFTLPEGTEFSTDDARVTMLTGDDLMTRNIIDATFIDEGNGLVSVTFDKPAKAGGYFRVEIFKVFFPAEGGSMDISGTYTLADGSVHQMKGVPSIAVTEVSTAERISQSLSEQGWVKAWNSNKFLHMFFDPTLIVTSLPVVFRGFLMAIAIVAVAFPLAIPFGLLFALMRMSKLRVLRAIGGIYVNVVRGTPLFLQIYIAFFGLPLAGVHIPAFPLGVIVLAMNSCAYMCEIFRAGIQSIPKGQFEAARSLGMTGAQTMIFVIIPQTVRRVIPTLTSEFILLYKDTSMLAAVGVMEVVMYAKTIVAATGSITPYIVAACFYLVITLPLAKVVGNFESRLASNETGKGVKKKKKKRQSKKDRREEQVAMLAACGDAAKDTSLNPDAGKPTGVGPGEASNP